MSYWKQSSENIYVAAHRGFSEKYPENTMEAFRAALALGVDQIETDVRMTKDGELVLLHDATVDRTTNGTGVIEEMTLAEVKALDAGIRKGPEFAGCRIPTLRELFELVKDHPTFTLDLEFKEYPENVGEEFSHAASDKILAMVAEYGFEDRIVVNSFCAAVHEYVLEKYGHVYRHHVFYPVSYMGTTTRDPYEYAYCACICGLSDGQITEEEVKDFHQRTGVRIWNGSSVRDDARAVQTQRVGTELVTVNNADEVLQILRKHGWHA